MVLRAVTYRIKSGFSIKARPERSRMGVERQHIKTPSHGDLSGICLIFGIGFSIIPNKIAIIGDFVIYDLLITIYYFFPRNQRNPRLLIISL